MLKMHIYPAFILDRVTTSGRVNMRLQAYTEFEKSVVDKPQQAWVIDCIPT